MSNLKKIKWLPVISFGCVLILLFSCGSLVNTKIGGSLVGMIIAAATTLNLFFPKHLKYLMDLWSEKIIAESHQVIVFISITFAVILIFVISREYRIDIIKIKKNE